MQEMQWDEVQRGPGQGVQKTIFPGQHFVSSVRGRGEKKKKVVLHTKQKMPSTPFNIRVYSLFHDYNLRMAWNTLFDNSDFWNLLTVSSSSLHS